MTAIWSYFSPTTPTAATFTEDLSDYVRLGGITGLVGEAELGAVGIGSQAFDDEGSTIGHAADGIVGLKQMYVDETACPAGNQRLWTGYIGPRDYKRGDTEPSGTPSSLILGADRKIDTTLLDVNSFLEFRVFAPTADDPTSDFDRPAETDIERITALLTDVDFLSTTLFDIGYVNPAGPVDLDENDYTGARPIDVLADCAAMSGKNFFVMYDETTNQLVLWYDFWYSDGVTTIPFDSTIRLTNVSTEVDATTLAINPGATEVLDPSRVVSAAWGPYDGGTAYRTLPSTANVFAWRDAVVPLQSVKTLAKAEALLDRYLLENSTEDPRISLTVKIPNTQVTLVREGMRIQLHATHLPLVNADFTWCRILQRTIRQDVETPDFYWLDLELSPVPEPVEILLAMVFQIYSTGPFNQDPSVRVGNGSGPSWSKLGSIETTDSDYPGVGTVSLINVSLWWTTVSTGLDPTNVAYVQPGGNSLAGAWVFQLSGIGSMAAGAVFTDNADESNGTDHALGTGAASSVLFGGYGIALLAYAYGLTITALTDTTLEVTADQQNDPSTTTADISPPWCVVAWHEDTGAIDTHIAASPSYDPYTTLHQAGVAVRIPLVDTFSVVQSAHGSGGLFAAFGVTLGPL